MAPLMDLDAARAFVLAAELGSLVRAAERIGRTPSAVTLQMQRLSRSLGGASLFARAGRGLRLTPAGETALVYARRMLALNEEALAAMRELGLSGRVRVGLPHDLAETVLTQALSRFVQAHARVRVDVQVARQAALAAELREGALDVAVLFETGAGQGRPLPMLWIGGADAAVPEDDAPLPLLRLDPPCVFQSAAEAALRRAGRRWRVVLTSASVSGLWAAAAAGLGVFARTGLALPETVRAVPDLPALPQMRLAFRLGPQAGPAARTLAALLEEAAARLPVRG